MDALVQRVPATATPFVAAMFRNLSLRESHLAVAFQAPEVCDFACRTNLHIDNKVTGPPACYNRRQQPRLAQADKVLATTNKTHASADR